LLVDPAVVGFRGRGEHEHCFGSIVVIRALRGWMVVFHSRRRHGYAVSHLPPMGPGDKWPFGKEIRTSDSSVECIQAEPQERDEERRCQNSLDEAAPHGGDEVAEDEAA
jgi:hypothetical protein